MTTVVSEYRHCGKIWVDTWDSVCDSECPTCNQDIEAFRIIYESIEEEEEEEECVCGRCNACIP